RDQEAGPRQPRAGVAPFGTSWSPQAELLRRQIDQENQRSGLKKPWSVPIYPARGIGRMDKLSIIGLAVAIGAIIGGQILEGGTVGSLLQFAAFMIVMGGTLGAVMLQSPL